ncbi:AI-2E family transporter [Jeotgalicoccus meleagridis]|jgi:predicted PurR-regulated permease PerM|uniref:Pheromone autoinducer 2 transporter n=1 Tax=Jeotgalicoccus meleagridis TaxID=2759181 RepID=A0A6V7RPR8_9STAP|nr:AI-2E family transporter [Jeotgalicoccus meleagridis]CAD2079833.1 pheromone autoinducer 2 transporter [Jeotgalicoccus meleagridis]HIW37408.1 AI-2E family transporter [Candidatus Jeotgalicoccus stercoravium]
MTKKLWFQSGIALIITFVLILLMMQVKVIFAPFMTIIMTIFFPALIGGMLYYITEPIQRFLEKRKANRAVSILSIFIIILIVLAIITLTVVPMVTEQIQNLVSRLPMLQREVENIVSYLMSQRDRLPFDIDLQQITQDALDVGTNMLSGFVTNAISIVSSTVSVLLTLVLGPFFFFFMLKDHQKFIPAVTSPFSGTFKQFLTELLYDIDRTLRSFVQGQMLVSSILCVILYIGYAIIGLDYALLLAIFALFMNVVPFVGPWVAFIPAGLLALIQDPIMFIWVSIITLVAQQIESNLITPNVMGQSLSLHPLTVITIVLAAGNIAGFIGILIAIPTYTVIKTIIQNIWRYRQNLKDTMLNDISG